MAEQILIIRETAVKLFKHYETLALFIFKFLVGLLAYGVILGIGHPLPQAAAFFAPPFGLPLLMLLSILFAICPLTLSYGLMTLIIGVQVSGMPEVGIFVFLFLVCVLLFYVRLAPRESVLILATFFGFYFKVPYLIPLVAGLYFSLTSAIPIAIGVFIYYASHVIGALLSHGSGQEVELLELPGMFAMNYATILDGLKTVDSWIFTAFIFAMVVVTVYAISRTSLDFSKDLAIGIGGVVCIVSHLVAALVADVNIPILPMLLLTIVSALLAEVIKFFDVVLDYQRAERVQFEDETNYYMVKVIPKVMLSKRNRVVRRIEPAPAEAMDFDLAPAASTPPPPRERKPKMPRFQKEEAPHAPPEMPEVSRYREDAPVTPRNVGKPARPNAYDEPLQRTERLQRIEALDLARKLEQRERERAQKEEAYRTHSRYGENFENSDPEA